MIPALYSRSSPLGRQPDDERRRQLLSPWLSSTSPFLFGCRQAIRIRASWPGARFAPALRWSPANPSARSLAAAPLHTMSDAVGASAESKGLHRSVCLTCAGAV